MDYNYYLTLVSSRLSSHYDLTEGFTLGSLTFDLAARFVLKNERYLFSKHVATLDSCHNTTLCLVKRLSDQTSPAAITQAVSYVTQELAQLVNPHADHMSTTVNLILVADDGPAAPEIVRTVQAYRFYKSFALGLRGWCHIGLVLVNLGEHAIYANKVGKGVLKAFDPQLDET